MFMLYRMYRRYVCLSRSLSRGHRNAGTEMYVSLQFQSKTNICMSMIYRMYRRYVCLSYMGWLRLVGSLKPQVSFAEYRLFYRALLQTRPIILRSLPIVATPLFLERVSRYRNVCRLIIPICDEPMRGRRNKKIHVCMHIHIYICIRKYVCINIHL